MENVDFVFILFLLASDAVFFFLLGMYQIMFL